MSLVGVRCSLVVGVSGCCCGILRVVVVCCVCLFGVRVLLGVFCCLVFVVCCRCFLFVVVVVCRLLFVVCAFVDFVVV